MAPFPGPVPPITGLLTSGLHFPGAGSRNLGISPQTLDTGLQTPGTILQDLAVPLNIDGWQRQVQHCCGRKGWTPQT